MIKIDLTQFKSNKVIDFETAAKKISDLKKAHKSVGVCHGGFDLLHPGHIKHLESASKLCDYLFVSITSDRFVTARKGSGRPIFPETLRAYSVASISYVDYVVISDFKLATKVVEKLKPSYYIKGPDFMNKTTLGITAEINKIRAIGGDIKYTNDTKLSTTEIIKYIQGKVKRKKLLLVIDRDGTIIEDVKFLGKDKHWKEQIKLKNDVIYLLNYIQMKYDVVNIVISNQQGVARNYFDIRTVKQINRYIDTLLRNKGIIINNWQYCPNVDKKYAASKRSTYFDPAFVKDKTKRKPSPEMLSHALYKLHKKMKDFDKILVIGNNQDDAKMAKNISAKFIDVTNKTYRYMKKEFDNI